MSEAAVATSRRWPARGRTGSAAARAVRQQHRRDGQAREQSGCTRWLTATLLVAAERRLALGPASATSLHVHGVPHKDLSQGGGYTRVDAVPERRVELHATRRRESVTPVIRRVLAVIDGVADEA